MIYFSLYVDGHIDGMYDYDYLNFDRENWQDILKLIDGIKIFYPFEIRSMRIFVYSHFCLNYKESNTVCLSRFTVTFDEEYKTLFTYEKE